MEFVISFLARLNRPWLHFVVIGALLFILQERLFPEPKPVVGPLSEARIEVLRQKWFTMLGSLPTEEQQARLVRAELDREILYQRALELELHLSDPIIYQRLLLDMSFLQLVEVDGKRKTEQELYEQALDMRLHLGDAVVKRRLIQVMERLLLAANPPEPVSEDDIIEYFTTHRQELRRPPRYSIDHLYVNSESEADIENLVQTISDQGLSPEQAFSMSSPFLPGYRFVSQSPEQLARHFGTDFVINLQQAGPVAGQWLGPIRSIYGMHYVWIVDVEKAREVELDEVRDQLQQDIESLKLKAALDENIVALRERYEVML